MRRTKAFSTTGGLEIILGQNNMKILSKLTKKEPYQQGFTLIELLVVIVIMGIAASIAIPSFVNMINEYRLTSQANDMIASLNLARSVSVKQRRTITIAKTGVNWNDGWQIFVDLNNNGTKDGDNDTLIKAYSAFKGSVTITGANFVNFIRYTPNGRANTMGNFTFCPPSSINSSRKITISNSGRMRTETDDYGTNCS